MSESSVAETMFGTVKWFSDTKGFGFLICAALGSDVLIHRSRLRGSKHQTLPEGAEVEFTAGRNDRGWQVEEVVSVDCRHALPPRPSNGGVSRQQLSKVAADFERVEAKWYSAGRGYGFVIRDGTDVFVHAVAVHAAGMDALQPGDSLEARIASGPKGLIVAELRRAA